MEKGPRSVLIAALVFIVVASFDRPFQDAPAVEARCAAVVEAAQHVAVAAEALVASVAVVGATHAAAAVFPVFAVAEAPRVVAASPASLAEG